MGSRAYWARRSEEEHNAVQVNPPDDRLDRPGTPMGRKKIEANLTPAPTLR